MGTLKKVRFKLAWQGYSVGDIIQPAGTLREWLLANGYVELIEEQPARAEAKPKSRRKP